jgi:hypothetical protein
MLEYIMLDQNNIYKKKYLKYKKKYIDLKMVGGTFILPSQLKNLENLDQLPILNNNRAMSTYDFNKFVIMFDLYIEKQTYLKELKNSIIDDIFMNKYDASGCLRSITPFIMDQINHFYRITEKIGLDFYVFRSIRQSAIKSNIINNYIPFSTAYNLDCLFAEGTSYGGPADQIVILQIKINKDNIYFFIGGPENEITLQPGKITINTQYKYKVGIDHYIIYDCDFEPYSKEEALILIDKNKC